MNFFALLHRVKPLDWIFFAISLTAAVASTSVYMTDGKKPLLVIESSGKTWLYETTRDNTLHIDGAEGVTVIQIEGGRVFFTESPCLNKTCITAHAISQPNQWIACLPNRIFARIEGVSTNTEVDVISN